MSLSLALVLALAGTTGLCGDRENPIEPDMRVLESDLDQASAIVAADKLSGMISRGEVGGEFQFGVLNQLTIIRGHTLLQQAQADRSEFGPDSAEARDSTNAFCSWLVQDGFWHD